MGHFDLLFNLVYSGAETSVSKITQKVSIRFSPNYIFRRFLPICRSNSQMGHFDLLFDLGKIKFKTVSNALNTYWEFPWKTPRGISHRLSRAWAEPPVWTPCSSDQIYQAYTQNLSQTLFTLKAQPKLSSGLAQNFLSRTLSWASVKCPPSVLGGFAPWLPPRCPALCTLCGPMIAPIPLAAHAIVATHFSQPLQSPLGTLHSYTKKASNRLSMSNLVEIGRKSREEIPNKQSNKQMYMCSKLKL